MRRPQGRLSFSATDASVIQVRKLVTPDPSGFRTFHIDRRRLTRYRYNNVPADAGGRYLYVNDGGGAGAVPSGATYDFKVTMETT